MSSSRRRFVPLLLFGLAVAACQDPLVSPDDTGPGVVPRPQFAQGDNGTWTVNTLAHPGDGVCDDVECTLREAIIDAASEDRIVFAAGLVGDIAVGGNGGLNIIAKSLSIDGAGRIGLDGGGVYRVLVVDGVFDPIEVTLTGLTIKNGSMINNAGWGAGLAVGNMARVRLDRVTVVNNETAENGGGIYVDDLSTLELVHSTVSANTAAVGGGIYNGGDLTILASTISGNTGESAGGIRNLGEATATIVLSTISGNQSTGSNSRGGAILNSGSVTLRSSTIAGNSAGDQGGGLASTGGTATLANTIMVGNTTGGGLPDDCDGVGNSSLGHNLTGDCFSGPTDLLVTPPQVYTEVLDVELKDNGGPTETHALIARGRAVDAGYCPGETTDQRGFGRPIDDPVMPNALDACDIGAYELQGPFVARTDLIVSQSANKTSVKAGDLLTYTVRVRNLGPETAPNVVVTNVLSTGVTFVSATHGKGTHTAPPAGETGTVTWYLGDLLDQGNETTDIQVTVRIKGRTTITNKADVASDAVDPNPANNTASLTTSVAAGGTKPPGKGK